VINISRELAEACSSLRSCLGPKKKKIFIKGREIELKDAKLI